MSNTSNQEKETLEVELREKAGKGVARKLRASGKIPGTLYGHGLKEARSLVIDPEVLYDLLTTKRRSNIVFRVKMGDETIEDVMVRDYQLDPVRRHLLHADLVAIDPSKPVDVTVPAETVGRPIGVRQGGRLQMVRNMIPVRCLPKDIPLFLEHNVTKLSMGQSVLASQIKLPEGVEPNWPVDFAVVRIAIPRGAALPAGGDEEEEEEGSEETAATTES